MSAAMTISDPWFTSLAPGRRQALLDRARSSSAPTGARVYGVGDPPDGLWAVVGGEVRLVSYPAVGIESVAMILAPGAWFGELSVLDGGPRPHDAVVVRPAELLHVPLAAFEQVAAAHPLIYRDLGRLVCSRQRSALTFMGQAIAQPIAVRLARVLAGAARASGRAQVQVRQEDLAAMVGVSRQTANRTLRGFERAGLIELAYGRITVCDPERLRAVA
ncbi:Crp/Fnr family transcriptional regulator [Phenylobacterium sp.]|uniref:Crp/Fnr family transcriptional regulator n=1 Tax=Phenylobacterium sp. TaxID=1871053 RepID=UPI00301BC7BB